MKTIQFPLNNTKEYFDTVDDYMSVVKQNIKNMFLTNPGERVIRRNKIGIPLGKIFFENNRDEALEILKSSLQDNMRRYFPSIKVDYVIEVNADANKDTNRISIEIKFTDTNINVSDILVLNNN